MSATGDVSYLDTEAILGLHEEVISHYGGDSGVRDMALLESAVGRYQSGYYANRLEEAAALMESLLQNHPFIDGNKRTAFAAVNTFLQENGYKITIPSKETHERITSMLQAGDVTHENLVSLLEEITEQVER